MKTEFNLIKSSNQNIIINAEIIEFLKDSKKFSSFSYNKRIIFKYSILILDNKINIFICPYENSQNFFYKIMLGSFLLDQCHKFTANKIRISCKNKDLLDYIVLGFMKKNFQYTIHKTGSSNFAYETKYNLCKKNHAKLKSINFLKELVSEPSNIIFPESFAKKVKTKINKKFINLKILDKSKIEKIGLNCLLAVNQGSVKEPRVIEFCKKQKTKNIDILFVGKGVCFDSGGNFYQAKCWNGRYEVGHGWCGCNNSNHSVFK